MQRHTFQQNGLNLSYLDSGGHGKIIIALHAHWMEGKTFEPLAVTLMPKYRVIALDQRGHGYSDHPTTYTRNDYMSDLEALVTHLDLSEPVIMLGNSLGGINTYQFAARHPHLINAMIIEDIGVEISIDVGFSLAWRGTFKTRENLEQAIGPRFITCLQESFRQTKDGWKLAFDPQDLLASCNLVQGDHWSNWLATDCPALLIRGKDSTITTHEHFEEMALRRHNTNYQSINGGHVVHLDNPIAFSESVCNFLMKL